MLEDSTAERDWSGRVKKDEGCHVGRPAAAHWGFRDSQ